MTMRQVPIQEWIDGIKVGGVSAPPDEERPDDIADAGDDDTADDIADDLPWFTDVVCDAEGGEIPGASDGHPGPWQAPCWSNAKREIQEALDGGNYDRDRDDDEVPIIASVHVVALDDDGDVGDQSATIWRTTGGWVVLAQDAISRTFEVCWPGRYTSLRAALAAAEEARDCGHDGAWVASVADIDSETLQADIADLDWRD